MGAVKEWGVIFVWGIYQLLLYLEKLVLPSFLYLSDDKDATIMDISKIAKNLVKSVASGEVRIFFVECFKESQVR